jgi:hypothetical protein
VSDYDGSRRIAQLIQRLRQENSALLAEVERWSKVKM